MEGTAPTTATRGDTTRESLLRAAIEIFGRDGFGAASTRAISERAGVNQALIGYHFGGKPGLYRAALTFIADSVLVRLGPLVATLEAELDAGLEAAAAGPEKDESAANGTGAKRRKESDRALALLHELTDAFVGMLTSDESAAWARLILREQQDPSEGFDILYEGVMHRILGVTARLVARARRSDATARQCRLTALTIIGQALVFRVARAAVLREMEWPRLSAANIEAIQAEVRRNVTAVVKAEIPR